MNVRFYSSYDTKITLKSHICNKNVYYFVSMYAMLLRTYNISQICKPLVVYRFYCMALHVIHWQTQLHMIRFKFHLYYKLKDRCNTLTLQKKTKRSLAMHVLPNELYHCYQLDSSISNVSVVWYYFVILFELQLNILLVNSKDPDQTPHSVASDLGMHCLSLSHNNDEMFIWANEHAS